MKKYVLIYLLKFPLKTWNVLTLLLQLAKHIIQVSSVGVLLGSSKYDDDEMWIAEFTISPTSFRY